MVNWAANTDTVFFKRIDMAGIFANLNNFQIILMEFSGWIMKMISSGVLITGFWWTRENNS
jgi:hypothetical protein